MAPVTPIRETLQFPAEQAARFRMQAGRHYLLSKAAPNSSTSDAALADNLIATRHGSALQVRYANGSGAVFEDFYSVCTDASICSVTLEGDTEAGYTLSGQAPAGSVPADGGVLVYAHGQSDVLMAMAQGQTELASTLASLHQPGLLTYLPTDDSAALHAKWQGILIPTLGSVALAGSVTDSVFNAAHLNRDVTNLVSTVLGDIQAGPVQNGHDLEVNVYGQDGTSLLASNVPVDSTGYFVTPVGNYAGVVFARLANRGNAPDYLDEATNAPKDLNANLMAVGVISTPGATLRLNINVLSTLAANKLGGDFSAANVARVNAAVAQAFGLAQLHGTDVVTTNGGRYSTADGLSGSEDYGAVLAALSGMDWLNGGNVQTTLDQLINGFSMSGSTGFLSAAAKYQVVAGAKTVASLTANRNDINNGTPFADVVAGLIQYLTDPATEAQALANIAAAAGNGSTVPTLFDYANANISGIDSAAKLSLINDAIRNLVSSQVDTKAEVQALVDAAAAVLSGAAGGTAPTQTQLQTLGITGVTVDNLAVIQHAIAVTADSGIGVDTQAEIQALVNAINTALGTISSYAQANSASSPATPTGTAPDTTAYANAGVSGVDSTNLGSINDALTTSVITGAAVDTPAEVQALVDAYNAILAEANAATADATTADPTAPQYTAIGADIGVAATDSENLALLNDSVGAQATSGVDTVAEIDTLARIANAIQLTAAGGTPSPALALADFNALGLNVSSLSGYHLSQLLTAIAAKADGGLETDSLPELQALVDAIDTTPPAAPGFDVVAANDNIEPSEFLNTTFTGTCEAGATVVLTMGDGSTRTATVAGTNWSYVLTSADVLAMGDGAEAISVVQTDAALNSSTATTRNIQVGLNVVLHSTLTAAGLNDSSLVVLEAGTLNWAVATCTAGYRVYAVTGDGVGGVSFSQAGSDYAFGQTYNGRVLLGNDINYGSSYAQERLMNVFRLGDQYKVLDANNTAINVFTLDPATGLLSLDNSTAAYAQPYGNSVVVSADGSSYTLIFADFSQGRIGTVAFNADGSVKAPETNLVTSVGANAETLALVDDGTGGSVRFDVTSDYNDGKLYVTRFNADGSTTLMGSPTGVTGNAYSMVSARIAQASGADKTYIYALRDYDYSPTFALGYTTLVTYEITAAGTITLVNEQPFVQGTFHQLPYWTLRMSTYADASGQQLLQVMGQVLQLNADGTATTLSSDVLQTTKMSNDGVGTGDTLVIDGKLYILNNDWGALNLYKTGVTASDAGLVLQNALNTLASYAAAGSTAPTIATYAEAGVQGVDAQSLAGINAAVLALGTSAEADSTSEIQEIVNIQKTVQAIVAAGNTADFVGSAANDSFSGTAGSESFVGGSGQDTFTGNGGADAMFGGIGNDTFVLNASNVTALQSAAGAGGNGAVLSRIDGGPGMDTIQLSGGANIDFSLITNTGAPTYDGLPRINSVEIIDLKTDAAANTVTLQLADVLEMAGQNLFNSSTTAAVSGTALALSIPKHQVAIYGDALDTATIGVAGWTNSGTVVAYGGHNLVVFNSNTGAAQLLIEQAIVTAGHVL